MPVAEVVPEERLAPEPKVRVLTDWERRSTPDWSEPQASIPVPRGGSPVDENIEQAARRLIEDHVGRGRVKMTSMPIRLEARAVRGAWQIDAMGHIGRLPTAEEPSGFILVTSDPLAILLPLEGETLRWVLLPAGPSVTARADALRMLRTLAFGAAMSLSSARGNLDLRDFISVDPSPWRYEDEWRLFEDLAALEEWAGTELPMPREVSAEEATSIAQAAMWARTQRIDTRLEGTIRFQAEHEVAAEADELRVHQEFEIEVLGMRITLGVGDASIPIAGAAIRRRDDRILSFEAAPRSSEVAFTLRPPEGVNPSGRRTGVILEARGATGRDASASVEWLTERGVRPPQRSLEEVLHELDGILVEPPGHAATRALRQIRPVVGG